MHKAEINVLIIVCRIMWMSLRLVREMNVKDTHVMNGTHFVPQIHFGGTECKTKCLLQTQIDLCGSWKDFNDMKKYNSLVHCYRDFHFSNPLILRKSAPRWRLLGTATVNHAFSGNHNNFWHPGRLIDFPYHTYRPSLYMTSPKQLQTLDLSSSLLQAKQNKCFVGTNVHIGFELSWWTHI